MVLANSRRIRWVFEFLLAMVIAWGFVWRDRQREIPLSYRVLARPLSSHLKLLYQHSRLGEGVTVVEQLAWSLVLAALIFLLLRLLSLYRPTTTILRSLGGIVALAHFPLLALLFPQTVSFPHEVLVGNYNQLFYVAHTYRLWLLAEVLIACTCVALYYLRRWRVPPLLSTLLLILHFGLWSWATGMYANPVVLVRAYGLLGAGFSIPFHWGFPVIGFLSTLAWGLYVRPTLENHSTPQAQPPREEAPRMSL